MDIYEAINTRRTIRDFSEREIDIEVIKKIIKQKEISLKDKIHMNTW